MQGPRPPLTSARIVAECRALLVEGGVEALVVREVARRLEISYPTVLAKIKRYRLRPPEASAL